MNHHNPQSVDQIIDSCRLSEGDALIGLACSGIHSGGLSSAEWIDPNALGSALRASSRSYDKAVTALLDQNLDIHAISHINGSLYEHVPPMMSDGLTAQIILHRLPHLPIFEMIQNTGKLSDRDMHHTFNMGIGMVVHGDEGVVLV